MVQSNILSSMSNPRPFPSAFQNMNRNRNSNQRPQPQYNAPAVPAPPPKPKTPNPLELNDTNFPILGNNVGPNQMHVFDMSFAKRIERTKLVEDYKRRQEERMKEDQIKAQLESTGFYMLNIGNRSSSPKPRYESDEEDYIPERVLSPYKGRRALDTDDDGWTTVKNTKAFKPKHTLSVEELYVKHRETEELDEPELHTTEEGDELLEYGYRHSHG